MENRKDSLSALKLCRFCLTREGSLSSLYDRTQVSKNAVTLPLKILSSVSIEVFPSDKMPCFICSRCKFFMELLYEYKQICRQADETILQYVQKGTSLETVVWPPSLVKLFHYGAKNSTDIGVVKTILEGGATVQVTSQEISDDDEEDDDENVYNIKIGDATEEDSKATCIEVVTSKDKIGKIGNTKDSKGFSTVSKLTRHVRTHAGERSYPCKHCNKCFTKSHHYTRHLRQKHEESMRSSYGAFGHFYQYRCEQCEDSFATQDELIYHSAIHATQNLTCPLCQEKFENVDAVTVHIKTHVNGTEFMCDLCELVFTSKEKLDKHLSTAHEEELQADHTLIDESSTETKAEDEDEDTSINVKEEYDHMLVEIKKPNDFMITNPQNEDRNMNTNSEESEVEMVEENVVPEKESKSPVVKSPVKTTPTATFAKSPAVKTVEKTNESQTASILRKAEEIKRKVNQNQTSNTQASDKNAKSTKGDSSNTGGASDKSLRLLEKELQDLKRTNSRNEAVKTPMKAELLKSRRPQIHTSTPKPRIKDSIEEKKLQQSSKPPATEKKPVERRAVTKENKEPKDVKDTTNNVREEKEIKEKDIPKNVKNGTNASSDKSRAEETVRRSTRPSKIKDYAKMIRDRSQDDNDDDDSDDTNDEEYKEVEKSPEPRKPRRASTKQIPKPVAVATPAATPRKRGRPRKNENKELPSKIKKESHDEISEDQSKTKLEESIRTEENSTEAKTADDNKSTDAIDSDGNTAMNSDQKLPAGVLVSPTGQTLKKVPIKALPPGVRPLPLPTNARPMGPGEFCEMQIGKKVVKVQKIVMTKAEVEAMAKKGLVEMKDGTMVLKQGIKIPTADSVTLKSTLVGEETIGKESPIKKDKPAPMRCDLGEPM